MRSQTGGSRWYRLVDPVNDFTVKDLTITGVERLLAEMCYDLADIDRRPWPMRAELQDQVGIGSM